jgi:hypothetical protein
VRAPHGARMRKEPSSFAAAGSGDDSGGEAGGRTVAYEPSPAPADASARRRQFSLRVLQQAHTLETRHRPQPPPQPSRGSAGSRPSLSLRLRTPHRGSPFGTVMDDIAGVAVTPVLSARDRHSTGDSRKQRGSSSPPGGSAGGSRGAVRRKSVTIAAPPSPPQPRRRASDVVAVLERAVAGGSASGALLPASIHPSASAALEGSAGSLPQPDRPDPRLHLHMTTPEPEPWLPYTNRKLEVPPVHWPGMSEVRKEHETEVASKLTRVSGGIRNRLVNVSSMFRTRSHHTRGSAGASDGSGGGGGADGDGGSPSVAGKGARKGAAGNRGASAAHADFRRFMAMPVLERGFGTAADGDVASAGSAPAMGPVGSFAASSATTGPLPGAGAAGSSGGPGMGPPKTSFASMIRGPAAGAGAVDAGGVGAVTRRAPVVAAPLPGAAAAAGVRTAPLVSPASSFRSGGDGSSSGGGAHVAGSSAGAHARRPPPPPPPLHASGGSGGAATRRRGRRHSASRRQLLRKPSRAHGSPDTQGSESSLSPSAVPARVRNVLSLFSDLGTLSPKLAGYTYKDLVSGKPVRHGMRLGLPDLFELARVANDRMLQVSAAAWREGWGGGVEGGVVRLTIPLCPPCAAHAGRGGARPAL